MAKAKVDTTASTNKQWTSGGSSGSNGPDAITQQRTTDIWNAAQAAGNAVPQSVTDALSFLNGQSNGSQYMNPYNQQVVDSYLNDLQHANAQTANQVGDQFTKAGAFGGSRQAVAQAVAQSENQRNTMGQIANLRQQGYSDATNRAMMAANLGMGADPNMWKLMALKQGFSGMPYGTTYQNRNNQTTTDLGWRTNVQAGAGIR